MIWFILVAVIIIIIITGISATNQEKALNEDLEKRKIDKNNLFFAGSYVGGHPDIDNHIPRCAIYPKDGSIIIFNQTTIIDIPKKIGSIDYESVIDITVEDSSSIEKKVTLGRVLLVGIFALAWRKKKKNELYFLSINWKTDRFEHSTLFSFEGKDAMSNANKLRNKLINLISLTPQTDQKPVEKPVENVEKKISTEEEIEKKLEAWQRMLSKGLITQDEFDKRKKEILD
jgi:hypothetical protein